MSDDNKPLSAAEIEELRELETKASPAPWWEEYFSDDEENSVCCQEHEFGHTVVGIVCREMSVEDRALITAMRNALPRLLSMLQPPTDAAVLEAVRYFDDLRGEWSDEQLEVHLETLLDYARAETPRLTREQKESALHLLSEMDKMLGEDMQPDDERPAALAMQRFCAAFPELGE